jgi:hypothetical protein
MEFRGEVTAIPSPMIPNNTAMGTVMTNLVRTLLREENQPMHMEIVTVMRIVIRTLSREE